MINLLDRVPKEYVRPEWRECMVPGRPWWTPVLTPAGYVDNSRSVSARRSDGKVITGVGQIKDGKWVQYDEALVELEAYDAENPLPDPGIRAGQVWALLWSQATSVIGPLHSEDIALTLARSVTNGLDRFDYFTPSLERDSRGRSRFRNQWDSVEGGLGWWIDHPPSGYILLADPCRPDLAPWSSSSKGVTA